MIRRLIRRRKPMRNETEAERAHIEAIVGLASTIARDDDVKRVTASLREWRERNHIVEQLDAIFGGSA